VKQEVVTSTETLQTSKTEVSTVKSTVQSLEIELQSLLSMVSVCSRNGQWAQKLFRHISHTNSYMPFFLLC